MYVQQVSSRTDIGLLFCNIQPRKSGFRGQNGSDADCRSQGPGFKSLNEGHVPMTGVEKLAEPTGDIRL